MKHSRFCQLDSVFIAEKRPLISLKWYCLRQTRLFFRAFFEVSVDASSYILFCVIFKGRKQCRGASDDEYAACDEQRRFDGGRSVPKKNKERLDKVGGLASKQNQGQECSAEEGNKEASLVQTSGSHGNQKVHLHQEESMAALLQSK